MAKHVHRILAAQRDILSKQSIEAIEAALAETRKVMADGADNEALRKHMASLEAAANKWLKPYPNASIRENVEVLLVALSVAMAIRTFFLQPFKIPTASMQPTLFGVMPGTNPTGTNDPNLKIPGFVGRFFDYWINGYSYINEVAPTDGQLEAVQQPLKLLLFNLWQDYQFSGKTHRIWFPPDELFQRVGYQFNPFTKQLENAPLVKAGEPILRLKVTAGDHLFVDRLTYNFRPPKRGEIIVFATRGTPIREQDQFYIKRLVALGGEKVQIGADRHLIIDGKRLDTNTPHFENVYSFDPTQLPQESHWGGHVGPTYPGIPALASRDGLNPSTWVMFRMPKFADAPGGVFTVRSNYYMVMGDNTLNSSDSRVWGDFSRTNVIGRYFFVYWPLSDRFGMNVK